MIVVTYRWATGKLITPLLPSSHQETALPFEMIKKLKELLNVKIECSNELLQSWSGNTFQQVIVL